MMNEYKYRLEKGSKKHHCPNCNKKRFVRYINIETNEYLPEIYGRCDRESKCGYFLDPYKDGYAKAIAEQQKGIVTNWKPQQVIKKPLNVPKRVYIPIEILNRTKTGYERNVFIQNLLSKVKFPFDTHDIEKVVSLYHLGTVQNGYRSGAITFPFIDINNNVRAIQVKQFDEDNHTTGTDFLHSIIEKHHTRNNKPLPEWLEVYNKNDKKVSCLFGEHLLNKYPNNPVALVEAPKSAVYGTLYFGFPEQPTSLIWLSTFNLSSLNLEKCQALKGRNVYLFPDLSKDGKAFELWSKKATEIQQQLKGAHFHVSDLLEQKAPQFDKDKGNDIADYLIAQDWQLFRKENPKSVSMYKVETFEAEPLEIFDDAVDNETPLTETLEDWSNDIAELESYYATTTLPIQPIKLNQCSKINDCTLFVKSHFTAVKNNNGNNIFLPYLHRLEELKHVLN